MVGVQGSTPASIFPNVLNYIYHRLFHAGWRWCGFPRFGEVGFRNLQFAASSLEAAIPAFEVKSVASDVRLREARGSNLPCLKTLPSTPRSVSSFMNAPAPRLRGACLRNGYKNEWNSEGDLSMTKARQCHRARATTRPRQTGYYRPCVQCVTEAFCWESHSRGKSKIEGRLNIRPRRCLQYPTDGRPVQCIAGPLEIHRGLRKVLA
ncbi:hypothetical protein LshimejAT787_0303520 [Lyophyllum shimeji]|uniref:Uncharacterized protein n=1 Tax=Lyophyllum shimeji TaxID=47721 RepID=A0A9P3PII6_LYOSH|nr:hypothetical protein LshimejAT787_0303520 [Lyophyllum shimeji]